VVLDASCLQEGKKKDLFVEKDVGGKILYRGKMATISKPILPENAQQSQVLQ
jgi:hypothetical protein